MTPIEFLILDEQPQRLILRPPETNMALTINIKEKKITAIRSPQNLRYAWNTESAVDDASRENISINPS
jgi:hypothetical protein